MALHCLVVNHNDFTVARGKKKWETVFLYVFKFAQAQFEFGLARPGAFSVPDAVLLAPAVSSGVRPLYTLARDGHFFARTLPPWYLVLKS